MSLKEEIENEFFEKLQSLDGTQTWIVYRIIHRMKKSDSDFRDMISELSEVSMEDDIIMSSMIDGKLNKKQFNDLMTDHIIECISLLTNLNEQI